MNGRSKHEVRNSGVGRVLGGVVRHVLVAGGVVMDRGEMFTVKESRYVWFFRETVWH